MEYDCLLGSINTINNVKYIMIELNSIAERTNEVNWRKALIVCQLIIGERDTALLSLELLLAELDSEDKYRNQKIPKNEKFEPDKHVVFDETRKGMVGIFLCIPPSCKGSKEQPVASQQTIKKRHQ